MDWNAVRAVPHRTSELTAPEQRRVLWRVERRKQFRCQVIQAAIRNLPTSARSGIARVYRAQDRNDLLHSEVARFDFTPLEEKAAGLREVLLEKGWAELREAMSAPPDTAP